MTEILRIRRGRDIEFETEHVGESPTLTKNGEAVFTPTVRRGFGYVPWDVFVHHGGCGESEIKLGSATVKVAD